MADKAGYAPTIPFWKAPGSNGRQITLDPTGLSVLITPVMYDTIMNNLKIGQVLYLNIFQPEENRPVAKIKFGPLLEDLKKQREAAKKYAPKPEEGEEAPEQEAGAGGDFFG